MILESHCLKVAFQLLASLLQLHSKLAHDTQKNKNKRWPNEPTSTSPRSSKTQVTTIATTFKMIETPIFIHLFQMDTRTQFLI